MNHILLYNYIRKLTKQDIISFTRNKNIFLSDDEIDIIYFYIKNRYVDFFNGNHQEILEEIREQVSSSTYFKILEYYNLYKDKL